MKLQSLTKLILILSITLQYGCFGDGPKVLNPNFEKEMVKALSLKFVNSDSLYLSPYTEIFNDTIVGYKFYSYPEQDKGFYFMQSLKNLKFKKIFKPNDETLLTPSYINALKNGCLYFGRFGTSYMTSVCMDGTTKDYFKNDTNGVFYANEVLLYKDKTAITSMNGVHIFNTESQKLLWKSHSGKAMFGGPVGVLLGNKLILESGELACVDMDKLTYTWRIKARDIDMLFPKPDSTTLNKDKYNRDYSGERLSKKKNQYLFLDKYVIDCNTGRLLYHDNRFYNLHFDDYDNGYLGTMDSTAYYLNSDFKILWKLKYARPITVYKRYVVAKDKDETHYLVIDKFTGKVKNKILTYQKNDIPFRPFNDGYIMLREINLYK